jgi:hypothetical protein
LTTIILATSKTQQNRQGERPTKVLLQAGLDVVNFGCGSLSAAVPADEYLLGFLL